MPGFPDCAHCPFRDDPNLPCAALETGHRRFCEGIDPASPTYRPGLLDGLVRLTLELAGRPIPDPPSADFPPLATQAASLAAAAVRAVASGGKQVTPDERERRLSICRGCEHFDAEATRCRACGCYLNLKSRLDAWHCPIEKW